MLKHIHFLDLLHLVGHDRLEVLIKDLFLLIRQSRLNRSNALFRSSSGSSYPICLSRSRNACLPECVPRTRIGLYQTDGLGGHDLIRGTLLEQAVLMDARLVRKGVGPTMALFGWT